MVREKERGTTSTIRTPDTERPQRTLYIPKIEGPTDSWNKPILARQFLDVAGMFVGIGAENLKRIFEFAFTTKERTAGHGIGLAISSHIVKDHGGHIEVVSEKVKGTTFHIYLPAAV